jgi:hypothetical protein
MPAEAVEVCMIQERPVPAGKATAELARQQMLQLQTEQRIPAAEAVAVGEAEMGESIRIPEMVVQVS